MQQQQRQLKRTPKQQKKVLHIETTTFKASVAHMIDPVTTMIKTIILIFDKSHPSTTD